MKTKTSVKKRIFAFMGVAIMLLSVLVLGVSADDGSIELTSERDYSLCNFYCNCNDDIDSFVGFIPAEKSDYIVGDMSGVNGVLYFHYTYDVFVSDNRNTISINADIFDGMGNVNWSISGAGGFYVYRDSFFSITDGSYSSAGDSSVVTDYSFGFSYGDNQHSELDVTGASVTTETLFAGVPLDIDVIYIDYLTITTQFYKVGESIDSHYNVVITNEVADVDVDVDIDTPIDRIDIYGVFTTISNWFLGSFENITPMFYGESGLTFMGVLAVVGLAVGLCLLIIAVVTKFLGFGG